jgi:hypothetical protein
LGLVIAKSELLLDILLEIRESSVCAISDHDNSAVQCFFRNMFGIIIYHVAEAGEKRETINDSWKLAPAEGQRTKINLLLSRRRINAPMLDRLATGDHVRLVAAAEPANSIASKSTVLDNVIENVLERQVSF